MKDRKSASGLVIPASILAAAMLLCACESIAGLDKLHVREGDASAPDAGDVLEDTGPGDDASPNDEGGLPNDAGLDATAPDARVDGAADAAPEPADGADAMFDADPDSGPPVCTGLICDGVCVPNDATHCGTCEHNCTTLPHVSGAVSCVSGGCLFDATACVAGYAHCSSSPDDGCETDLSRSAHCGGCDVACSGVTPICADPSGGDPGSDFACASGCSAGAPTLCGQTCVNTSSNAQHCAGCDQPCPGVTGGQPICSGSSCDFTCNSAFHKCGSGCTANNSVSGCGATSCTACPDPANGAPTCDGTSCGIACDSGFHACSGSCLSNTAVASCGSSCSPCAAAPANATATCSSGTCGFQCNAPDFFKNGSACALRNLYVSPSGADTNPGTQASPFKTYDRALNGAISGQIINFGPGTYTETFARAIPDGLTLQRTAGQLGTVTFAGGDTRSLVFSGGGTLRDVTLSHMASPFSASAGVQTIERVTVSAPAAPIQLAGSANATLTDCPISGAAPQGGTRDSLIRLTASARLTMRGSSSLSGNFTCGTNNASSSAIYASDSTQADLSGTAINGGFYGHSQSGALYFEGSAVAVLNNVTLTQSSACTTAAIFAGTSAAFITGGSYATSLFVRENATADISGTTFAGLSFAGPGARKLRGSTLTTMVMLAIVDMAIDLGTASSPGNNHLQGLVLQSTGASGTVYVNASGNTWLPNVQGADAAGHYPAGATGQSPDGGANYNVTIAGAVLRLGA